jgi:hypothetical protein
MTDEPRSEQAIRADLANADTAERYSERYHDAIVRLLHDVEPLLAALAAERARADEAEASLAALAEQTTGNEERRTIAQHVVAFEQMCDEHRADRAAERARADRSEAETARVTREWMACEKERSIQYFRARDAEAQRDAALAKLAAVEAWRDDLARNTGGHDRDIAAKITLLLDGAALGGSGQETTE